MAPETVFLASEVPFLPSACDTILYCV